LEKTSITINIYILLQFIKQKIDLPVSILKKKNIAYIPSVSDTSVSTKGKLLIIGERFFPEEFLINDVVETLQNEGFEITIITQHPSYPYGKIFDGYKKSFFSTDTFHGAKIIRTGVVEGYNQSVIRKLLNYIAFIVLGSWAVLTKTSKPDNILIYQTGPLSQAIIGIFAKWRFKKPLHIWTWDIWPDSIYAYGFKKTVFLSWSLDKFVTWVYRSCDYIMLSSPGFAEILRNYAPNRTFEVLPNWNVDNSVSPTPIKIEMPKGFNFTFTGNIGKVQNLDNVIKGFAIAVQKDTTLYLNLVGDGSSVEELKTFVASENIPNIIFWGRRPSQEMPAFYEASHTLIISLNAGSVWGLYIPSKFQAYLGAKKPIFAVIDGAVKEIVDKYDLGISADPHDVTAIAQAFLDIKNTNQEKQEKIAHNSQLLISQYFDRKQNLTKLASFFPKK
jgi:glycosyltransferase involved in cell wall biosynthesis